MPVISPDQNNNNQQFQQQTPQSFSPMPNAPQQTPPKSSGNLNLILIIIISVLVVVGGGVAAYFLLKPESKASKTNTTTTVVEDDDTETVATNKFDKCLNKSELKALQGDGEYTLKDIDGKYYVYESFFFLPNSTEYKYPDIDNETFTRYATEFPKIASKEWKIYVRGQIKDVDGSGNTAANKKLANDRANRVKNDIIAKTGIPSSRFTLEEPEIFTGDTGPDDSNRNVTLNIETQCSDKQIEL